MSENEILEYLLQEGKVTEEDVINAGRAGVDKVLNACASLMHSFFCQREHVYEPVQDITMYEGKKVCLWYMEQVMGKEWLQDEHQQWLANALDEMGRQHFSLPAELRDYLLKLKGVLYALSDLQTYYPKGLNLVEQFIQSLK